MQNWWMVLLAPGLAAAGYLARRLIEGRRRSETLRRRLQALALLNGMKRSGHTLRDLDRLSDDA